MSAVRCLLGEIEVVMAGRSAASNRAALARLADHVVESSERVSADGMDVLDLVLACYATKAGRGARAALSGKIAALENGPRRVLSDLALDEEIRVARPVLTRSPCLEDKLLAQVVSRRGRDHRVAICGRATISEAIADALVRAGGYEVRHALAGNASARLSNRTTGKLVIWARTDAVLQDRLGGRPDLPADHAASLVALARDDEAARLAARLPGPAREAVATFDESDALALLRPLASSLGEADLASFAAEARAPEAIASLSLLTGVPLILCGPAIRERRTDLVLTLVRSQDWSWATAQALLRLSDPLLTKPHHFARAEATFAAIPDAAAKRALRYLQAGGGATPRAVTV